MQVPLSQGLIKRLGIVAALALLGSLLFAAPSLARTPGHDHFAPSASDSNSGNGGESGDATDTRDPAHFDKTAVPVRGAATLYSECRFAPFANSTSVYSALGANEHDVVVGDTSFSFADGTSCYNPQNEQNIVVNPTDDQNVVTSANDYRGPAGSTCSAFVSKDGGATWNDYVIGGWTFDAGAKGQFIKTGCGGDPVMAFGPDGALYYAGLTFNLDKFPRQMSGVAVAKSLDGGVTWQKPVMVSYNATGNFFYDKPWLSVSPNGTLNLTWTKFYQGPRGLTYVQSLIVMSQSQNGGKSWSSVKAVSDPAHPFNQASFSATAPDGTLYVSYEGSDPTTQYNTDALVVASSTDGGTTFSTQQVARIYDDLDCYPIQLPGAQDRPTFTGEQFREFTAPAMAIDPTTGLIAIVWADDQGAGNCGSGGTAFSGTTSNQVKLVTSTNGTSWTLHQVTAQGGPDRFFPSVGANAGVLAVSYETREYATAAGNPLCEALVRDASTGTISALSTANVCYDDAANISTNGGSTWGSTIRLSSQSSNPYLQFAGGFIGDYEGTAVDSVGNVYTVWTDNRGNPGATWPNQDTYVGKIPVTSRPTHH